MDFLVGLSHPKAEQPIVNIGRNSAVYPLGASASSQRSIPSLRFEDCDMVVEEGQAWVVVGTSGAGKDVLLQSLLGHTRIHPSPPPPGGLFPFLTLRPTPLDPCKFVSLVSFSHRPKFQTGFWDYSARYGAVWDEDKRTLRETLFPELVENIRRAELNLPERPTESNEGSEVKKQEVLLEWLIEELDLGRLLDLPMIALSNGQTRKARIVKTLVGQLGARPELVLLDEGLTGLDASTRKSILEILYEVNSRRSPRIILGNRLQDGIPDWASHVAFVEPSTNSSSSSWVVRTGKADEMKDRIARYQEGVSTSSSAGISQPPIKKDGEVLVELKDVNVSYHERKILQNTNWTVRASERWHLQGSNGSGKTTLLSLLTGDHPQSYTQRAPSSLNLFGKSRNKWATVQLRKEIGIAGMDVLNAWPRGRKITFWEVVATGFDGGFISLGPKKVGNGLAEEEQQKRVERVDEILRKWWEVQPYRAEDLGTYSKRSFSDLPVGGQSLAIVLRALVGKPKLVLLDEAWSGMDADTVKAVHAFLRSSDALSEDQACVVVTHWEEEVPWRKADGIKKYILQDGRGQVV
ncbi:P-loop containing nucleoside triphosphate hydrolase protein [Thelephora ganbajun]|uniref:P-loop containing nucleoside triphosphate hydrolase protein n=1 Tax=Thelephora ganbajun TaxID=370292 RepID=A0ACB6ZL81_THEGA|nr:P-loop containing nucleoside triphosphate hydrolase protein [Thelephora ganbajun]